MSLRDGERRRVSAGGGSEGEREGGRERREGKQRKTVRDWENERYVGM